jgi:hypothetical protein
MPRAAIFAGSICTRTAGFCWPPSATCATPGIREICCASTFSAKSSTSVSGRTSECTDRMSIGESAGLTFFTCGGEGRFFGSCPPAASIADWMSCAAASMLRFRSNCTTICVAPRTLLDVNCETPGIAAN